MNFRREILAAFAGTAAVATILLSTQLAPADTEPQRVDPALAVSQTSPPPAPIPVDEPPPAQPSSASPTLGEVAEQRVDRKVEALAQELSAMWTRNPDELVSVIETASRSESTSPPVTLLLAIAHAETNGKVLEVSEAGAVGLAQATPVAYLQEQLSGRLFITPEYVSASRAYITKKPLGDADRIASMALAAKTAKEWSRARKLLESAGELRREGFEELELLKPFGPADYSRLIEAADEHNRTTLEELGRLIQSNDKTALRAFQRRVRSEYASLRKVQGEGWRQYQRDLIAARERMIATGFGDPAVARREQTYAVAEYLGEHLDARFSAREMARFLVRHLERKQVEAEKLANAESTIEEMTAALYNGGSHNVKRLLAGLITSLPETQRYMKKVPATRRRLDARVAQANRESHGMTAIAPSAGR